MKPVLIATFLAVGIFSAADAVRADGHTGFGLYEVNVGLLHHDTDNLWSGFRREGGVDLNTEVLLSSVAEIVGGSLHPAIGVSINSQGDTSKAYAGLRWRYNFDNNVFIGAGLGAAVHNGETRLVSNDKKALGSRVLFHIPFEVGYQFSEHYTGSIYFDHVSNANTRDENEGMDTLGIRIGYRF